MDRDRALDQLEAIEGALEYASALAGELPAIKEVHDLRTALGEAHDAQNEAFWQLKHGAEEDG